MRLLAIENEIRPLMLGEEVVQKEQVRALYNLYLKGYVREITQKMGTNDVILTMECLTKREAESVLASLPLVRVGKSTFELHFLEPYQGFKGVMK